MHKLHLCRRNHPCGLNWKLLIRFDCAIRRLCIYVLKWGCQNQNLLLLLFSAPFAALSLPRQQRAGWFVFSSHGLVHVVWVQGTVVPRIPAPAWVSPVPPTDSWPFCTTGTDPTLARWQGVDGGRDNPASGSGMRHQSVMATHRRACKMWCFLPQERNDFHRMTVEQH